MTDPVRLEQVVLEFSVAGGVETVAFELHQAFRASGVDARVLTSVTCERAPDVELVLPFLARIRSRGRLRHLGRALNVPAFTLAATWRLLTARRQSAGRVVLSHGDTLAGDVCVVHAVNRANLDRKRAAGKWRWRLNPLHLWVSWRDRVMIGGLRFRRYVALSARVASELQSYYGVPASQIVQIPNGVNLTRFSPEPDDRAETRRALDLPAGARVLLFVGHEFDRKGLAHVIDALGQPGLEAATLLVVGSGPVPGFAQQAEQVGVRDRVMFLGPRSDLPSLYRAANAFVLPTAYEAFSLVCMEALACGLPVFTTAVGGPEEYIIDGQNGYLLPADGAAIGAALASMLSSPELQARLSAGAIRSAQGYGWSAIAERYLALLGEVSREMSGQDATPPRRFGKAIKIAQTSNQSTV